MFTLAEIFDFMWQIELGLVERRTDSKPIEELSKEDIDNGTDNGR